MDELKQENLRLRAKIKELERTLEQDLEMLAFMARLLNAKDVKYHNYKEKQKQLLSDMRKYK